MSESARNEKLATVLSGEDHPLPPAISLAAGPKINANVKDLTLDNPYELALRVINLEVQSTKDPLCAGRLIVLHELAANAASDKIRPFVGLHEIAARISTALNVNYRYALDRGSRKSEVT